MRQYILYVTSGLTLVSLIVLAGLLAFKLAGDLTPPKDPKDILGTIEINPEDLVGEKTYNFTSQNGNGSPSNYDLRLQVTAVFLTGTSQFHPHPPDLGPPRSDAFNPPIGVLQ